jgi:hypothetical protein
LFFARLRRTARTRRPCVGRMTGRTIRWVGRPRFSSPAAGYIEATLPGSSVTRASAS